MTDRLLMGVENVIAQDIRIFEQVANVFACEQNFDHSGIMIVERVLNWRTVIDGFKDL